MIALKINELCVPEAIKTEIVELQVKRLEKWLFIQKFVMVCLSIHMYVSINYMPGIVQGAGVQHWTFSRAHVILPFSISCTKISN